MSDSNCKSTFTYCTASQSVVKGPCVILGAIVTGDGTNDSYLNIYHGQTTGDPQLCRINTLADTTEAFVFPEGIYLEKGIFASFETNLSSATIFWRPI